MTEEQKKMSKHFLLTLEASVFNHGDCDGADHDAHNIAVECGNISIKKRPCNLDFQRAFTTEGECVAEPEAPLDRNKKIVDDGDVLVAAPGEMEEELRSGTWATIRYAKKIGKPTIIIWPNGHITRTDK